MSLVATMVVPLIADTQELRAELAKALEECRRRKSALARKARNARRRAGRPGYFGVDTTVLFGGEEFLSLDDGGNLNRAKDLLKDQLKRTQDGAVAQSTADLLGQLGAISGGR